MNARVLLLAAGRGRRAGGPKAWRAYDEKTLLEAHLDFFGALVGAPSVSVSIQKEWRERCAALSPKTAWVDADPDAAPLDSLKRLIAASPAARSFVLHVDMPIFDRGVYDSLLKMNGDVVVPTFDGRRGHPVLLSPAALADVAALDSEEDRLDSWMRSRPVLEVAVATDSIHRNMNEAAA